MAATSRSFLILSLLPSASTRPWKRTATRSTRSSATSMSCSIRRIVVSRENRRIISVTDAVSAGEGPARRSARRDPLRAPHPLRPPPQRQDQPALALLAVRELPRHLPGAIGEPPLGQQRLRAPAEMAVALAAAMQREARGVEPLDGEEHALEHGEPWKERR